mmetsp:Transcript_32512/g.71060  ORF Transcript_32512/g.71060 Transcript_32512/m.71060 type:complete len:409 (-) Transcript_32512:393-1619(-)
MTSVGPSIASPVSLFVMGSACFVGYEIAFLKDPWAQKTLFICAAISTLGFFLTRKVIPVVAVYTERKGLFGYDINKRGTPAGDVKVPESLGLATGLVFLMCAIGFQLFHFTNSEPRADEWLLEYNAALASIVFMLFLGFVDDVLDIPWRYKLILPMVAAMPLLVSYPGKTDIAIPKPIKGLLQYGGCDLISMALPQYGECDVIHLGVLYHFYMLLLTIFCTNSINILAGVNGLEAGQSLVIAVAVLVHNLSMLGESGEVNDAHLFSAYLMMPFIATTLALLVFNWYPSKVFVGDTYTYFAGMTFAVAGILGHFSETLLLFFLPQLLNFLYSVPQLFKLVPCPRHRLPKLDPDSGLLHATPNMNLVNLALRITGPLREESLTALLLMFQVACCVAGFAARYMLAGWYKY